MALSKRLHKAVYRELKSEFKQNATRKTTREANQELKQYLNLKIFSLLDSGAIEWGGRSRKFVRACAAGLARAAETCAKEAKRDRIDVDDLKLALVGLEGDKRHPSLIVFWERTCPLPANRDRLGCCDMRAHLNMEITSVCGKLAAEPAIED